MQGYPSDGYGEEEEEWDREGLLDPAWEKQQKKVCNLCRICFYCSLLCFTYFLTDTSAICSDILFKLFSRLGQYFEQKVLHVHIIFEFLKTLAAMMKPNKEKS